jgi:hypothetical protein
MIDLSRKSDQPGLEQISSVGPVVLRTYERLLTGMVGLFEARIEPADRDARQAALAMAALLCRRHGARPMPVKAAAAVAPRPFSC